MKRVTKASLIESLMQQGLTRRQAQQTYTAIFDEISAALARGEAVSLRNFGRFSTRVRPFRWVQIPRDGEIVKVPERTHVRFRPSAALRTALDNSPDDAYLDAIIAKRRVNSRQLLSRPSTDVDVPVYDTQFDLGIAYREMGLAEKAANHFRAALDLLEETERGQRFVQCCYMLGLCLRDLRDSDTALRWFLQGVNAPRRPQSERLEFRYQIGLLHANQGRVREALNELLQVYLANPNFRQVAQHVQTLKELRRAQISADAATGTVR